jgi:hypothetical protein
MKNLFFAFFILFHSLSFSQKLKLSPSNPAPRAGDEIEIKIKKLNIKDAVLKFTALDTGKLIVGPFSFNVNGEIIKTDSLSIYVCEALPDN